MLVPKLRFKREDGTDYPEWKSIELNSIGSFYGGLSGKTKEDFCKGNSKFITYMNVYKNTFAVQEMFELVYVANNEKQNKVEYGDLLMTQSSETVEEVGMSSVYLFRDEPYLNSFCFGLHLYNQSNTYPKYIGHLMRSGTVRKKIMSEGQGISRINLSPNRIKDIVLPIPCLEEQQKIANFLSTVDEVIAQSRAEIQNLEQQKKAAMQKIFSQEVRFKHEDGTEYPEWEKKKIGDLLSLCHGKDYKHLGKGDIPVMGTGGIITYVDEALCDWECVCIGRKGTIDRPYYMDKPFWSVDTLFYSKPKKGNLPKFQYYLFQNINWHYYNEASGVPSLSASTIEKIRVIVPCLEEQQKIANFLSTYDEAISYAKQELDKWKELKKGLLQQMFV